METGAYHNVFLDMKLKQNICLLLLCGTAALYSDNSEASTNQDEHHCLALALYWEARGETDEGMIAVGWTILNRVNSPDFPDTPCRVVYQGGEKPPCQFSWWCDGKSDKPRNQKSWVRARRIAADLMNDPPSDPTKGALYFHSSRISDPWKVSRTLPIFRIWSAQHGARTYCAFPRQEA